MNARSPSPELETIFPITQELRQHWAGGAELKMVELTKYLTIDDRVLCPGEAVFFTPWVDGREVTPGKTMVVLESGAGFTVCPWRLDQIKILGRVVGEGRRMPLDEGLA